MWLRLVQRYRFARVDLPVIHYREHAAQASRRGDRMLRSHLGVIEKFFANKPANTKLRRQAFAYLYLTSALTYLQEGQRSKAGTLLLRSLASWPGQLPKGAGISFRPKLLARVALGESLFHKLKSH